MNQSTNLENSLLGKDLYVTQFDIDIPWFTILEGQKFESLWSFNWKADSVNPIPSTPFSISLDDAKEYGNKITKLALEKGALLSTLDHNITSYPVLGHVIFTVRFLSEPKINYLDKISRQELANLLKYPNYKENSSVGGSYLANPYDVVSYTPNWVSDKQRYIFYPSAYSKLNLLHIRLIKTTEINEHVAFCIFNTHSLYGKLRLEHIQLIKELLSNGDGKSFAVHLSRINENLNDPYYNEYLKYKSKYILYRKD